MLLISELTRVVYNVVRFSVAAGRWPLLIGILVVAAALATAGTVTVVGPLTLYPFL